MTSDKILETLWGCRVGTRVGFVQGKNAFTPMLFLNPTPLMSLIPQHFLALHLPSYLVGICWVPAGLAPFILPGLPKQVGVTQ